MVKSTSSKLFKLKKWLTLSETAKHLSGVCCEDVTEADILRLALDGHLKLSVYFVNEAYGIAGYFEKYTLPGELLGAEPVAGAVTKVISLIGEMLPEYTFVAREKGKVFMINKGVWDLPMLGSERLDVERRWQNLTDGPQEPHQCLGGVFVEGQNGIVNSLQELCNDDEDQDDSFAQWIESRDFWERGALPRNDKDYYPAYGLPEDSVFVVRAEALREFVQCISENEPENSTTMQTHIKPPAIQRANDFNECIAQVIADFMEVNAYAPTTVGEVINRMKHKPPLGTIVDFRDNEVSIDGSTPKPIANLERAIKRLLEQQKNSA